MQQLFGGLFAAGFRFRGDGDREDELVLTEREAREGCSKRVVVQRMVSCVACEALGACATCSGGGSVFDHQGELLIQRVCPTCHGTAPIPARCGECVDGFREKTESLELVVRPHTLHGSKISVFGKGDARPGRPAGHRYFVVAVDNQVTTVGHPYRASSKQRHQARLAIGDAEPTSSVPRIFAAMVLIVAGMMIALFAAGR